MGERIFLGFGFGAIQSGLFLHEAHQSKNFDRLIVSEVVPEVVRGLRQNGGCYRLNVATPNGVCLHEVTGVEALNPNHPEDRVRLVTAIADASEISTALPSVEFYEYGDASVAALLAEGLSVRLARANPLAGIVYTAENHNHAAEILEESVTARLSGLDAARLAGNFQFLNTVIGKMSRVVTDADEINQKNLSRAVPTLNRAFLVEEFNRILISRVALKGFQRGISVFDEKQDLFAFEDAKLYGHNATHALIGYLARARGSKFMFEAAADPALMTLARDAFLLESGPGVIAKHAGKDPLFTTSGYRSYVDDLLPRMVNPYLRDSIERVTRDPRRKLAWNDRLVGTMRLALEAGVTPQRFARAAAAALNLVAAEEPDKTRAELLDELWLDADTKQHVHRAQLQSMILSV